jgi:hypothetical protein
LPDRTAHSDRLCGRWTASAGWCRRNDLRRHLYEPYLIKGLLLVRAKLGRKSSSLLSNIATSIGSRPTADRAKERRRHFFEDDEPFNFADHERPLVTGSPGTPLHPPLRRLIYALTSLIAGMTGALGNELVSANLPYLQGALGLKVSEIAWPTAIAGEDAGG